MGALDVVQAYFDAWNSRDSAAIGANLGDSGAYEDPTTGGPISVAALTQTAGGLLAAFPDLSFEVVRVSAASETTVASNG
ncbi:MAG TPA: hypothetical protein EYM38_04030 [Dehalococcoidia bacterium]|nr:hypothetical protein [Dehalococcoidia bacterium]